MRFVWVGSILMWVGSIFVWVGSIVSLIHMSHVMGIVVMSLVM
jgi:predicted membrane chloride channel (bestrophin family)